MVTPFGVKNGNRFSQYRRAADTPVFVDRLRSWAERAYPTLIHYNKLRKADTLLRSSPSC